MHDALYIPSIEEIRACQGQWLYCDGGLLSSNPSSIGGTWAWCRVIDGVRVVWDSGVLEATPGIPVTNNVMELLALCHGLAKLPEGWRGTIVSDSLCTLHRRNHTIEKMMEGGVPIVLARCARRQFDRLVDLPGVRFVHIDGHPTQEHLATGAGKRGNRVSEHNKFCDETCNARKAEYFAERSTDGRMAEVADA